MIIPGTCKEKSIEKFIEITKHFDDTRREITKFMKSNQPQRKDHLHCWEQGETPACSRPLRHLQCCLCDEDWPEDLGKSDEVEIMCAKPTEEAEWEKQPAFPTESWEKEFDEEFKWFHIHGPQIKQIDCLDLSSDLKQFISLTLQKEREKVVKDLEEVKNILTYISTRNDLHNAVCISKAKEALEILQSYGK